jgi:glutathione S-transferase
MNVDKPLLLIGNKNYSSWSLRAWLVLKESGVDFEELRIPLYSEGYRDAIREHSPAGKVPVLVDGGLVVWDSLAIAEYVAEQVPSLWPSEPSARARARSITAEMHSGFPALREHMTMNCRARGRSVPMTDELSADIERVCDIWKSTRAEFGAAGDFLFGPFSIADAFFAPVVCRFVTYDVECSGAGADYMEAMLALPNLRAWLDAAEVETEVLEAYETGR